MEQDTNRGTTTFSSGAASPGGTHTPPGEARFTDYMSEVGNTVSSSTGRAVDFFTEHPLLTGSIVVGGMGAFIGSRLGHMVAMRRRRTFYDKAMDSLGLLAAVLGTTLSPKNREKAMRRLVLTGREVLGSTEDLRSTVKGRLPEGIPVDQIKAEGQPSFIRQVGYGISLIPITVALFRNPLVRNVAFRFLTRRASRR